MAHARRTLVLPLIAALLALLAGCGGQSFTQARTHTRFGVSPHAAGFGHQAPVNARIVPLRVPSLEMFDTVTLATVPPAPRAVAGYTSGWWPTFAPLVKAFPRALHVSIAISARHAADCLDTEPGDARPEQVVGWVRWMLQLGHRLPCVYTSVSEWGAVNGLLRAAGLSHSVRRWCAWYRYFSGLIAGCDAVQWTDHALNRNLDESTVALSFFGLTPPAPKPKPQPVRLKCWGPHAKPHHPTCERLRPLLARQSRARDATVRALTTNRCRLPYRRPVCRTLGQRHGWFVQTIHAELARY